MGYRNLIAITFAIGTIGFASANNRVAFTVNEPISVAGVPPVTLGPGSYVLRTADRSGGASVVQILSKRQDYVYTTVLTIPASRPYADDKRTNPLFGDTVRDSAGTALLVSARGDSGTRVHQSQQPSRLPNEVPHQSSCNGGPMSARTAPLRSRGARRISTL